MKKNKKVSVIEFCGNNSQYLRPLLVNGVAPIIGVGENEAEAYQDALNTIEDESGDLLPETYGNPAHDMAHYFGEDVAKEHAECDDSGLHVFCLIYIF